MAESQPREEMFGGTILRRAAPETSPAKQIELDPGGKPYKL